MPEYYKLNSRKITLREYWNITPSWKVLILWGAKLLNIPLQFGSGFRHFESVRELEVAEDGFSTPAREKLQPLLDQCLQLDFQCPRFFTFESIRRETRTSFIALLHRSGEFSIRLMHTITTNVHPPVENLTVVLLSLLSDGTYFFTSDQKPKFKATPGILANRLIGGDPARLSESHQQKLAALYRSNPPRPVRSLEVLDEIWDKYEKLSLDVGLKRGIYVPMTPEEVEADQKKMEAAQTMMADGVEHADVLAELNRLQDRKGGWGNAILIFVVSMVLFVGAGSRQWSWKYALMLVPILFIHELGHYVAMRAFNYSNLRMFFIPFFGAAVAGRHYNVPGWKKVIVSLMGPVPGIILGAIIGGAGLILHQALLIKVAIITLILNGINLVPVLPLDGGWIFHTLLFSRHYVLDAAFRVVAVIALILGGMFTDTKILMYLGIPMLLGIPAAYRMARIAATLRQRGLSPASSDDQRIPIGTAQAIIGEVKKGLPKMHTNKMVAQQTLQIFETLNARPPGWLPTIGFLFVHTVSVGMAVVFAGLFIVGQRGDLRGMLAAATRLPKHKLVCGSSATWHGDQASETTTGAQNTIVATFSKRSEVEKTFQGLTNRLPTTAVLKTFGESILLILPADQDAARKEWLGDLQRRAKDIFVDNTNFQAMLSMACLAPYERLAEEIESEFEDYLNTLPSMFLVPPWLPRDDRSPEQRAQHRLARQTYVKLQKAKWQGYDDPEMRSLQKKMAVVQKQGDQAEMTTLRKQMKQLVEDSETRLIEKVRAGDQGPVDANIVDLFDALSASQNKTNREENEKPLREIAQRMGQLPLVNGRIAPNDDRFSTRSGAVSRNGLLLNLTWISFNHVGDGAPALAEWLCAKGCSDLKYDFQQGLGLREDDQE